MFRFLPAVVVLQIITAGIVLLGVRRSADLQLLWILALFALVISVLAGFWFASIAQRAHQDRLTAAEKTHASEREKIRVNAERQKARFIDKGRKELAREARRIQAKTNFKMGATFAGAVAAGALMLFTQLMTVGLMVLLTAGGALAGYLTRLRQEQRRQPSAGLRSPDQEKPPPRLISGPG